MCELARGGACGLLGIVERFLPRRRSRRLPQRPSRLKVEDVKRTPPRRRMDKLFDSLVTLCCWLRVAASLTAIGVGLGVGSYYLLGGVAGGVVGGVLAVLGAYVGIRFANRLHRRDELVEVAYGLSPSNSKPQGGDDSDER